VTKRARSSRVNRRTLVSLALRPAASPHIRCQRGPRPGLEIELCHRRRPSNNTLARKPFRRMAIPTPTGIRTALGYRCCCLQHFTGTLDNWDPSVTDPLASGRESSSSTPLAGAFDWRSSGHCLPHVRSTPWRFLRRTRHQTVAMSSVLALWNGRASTGAGRPSIFAA